MSAPKVSAVIPVYNVQEYLPLCIESALAQTLQDIEIICVDDGSTDACPQMLDDYAARDPRVKVIHQPNGGYGKAMNVGLRAATGEYFAVLESDDFIMPDAYELLYKAAKQFDADVVRADYYDLTTVNGKPMLDHKQVTKDYSYYNRLICPNEELEVYGFVMHNWTGLHRIAYLREKDIWYHETPGASYQDNGFYFQVFTQTDRLVYIPRACYCYRIDNPGSSIHDPGKVYAMNEEYDYVKAFLNRHPEFAETVEPAYNARLFRACHQTYKRIDEKFRPEYLDLFYSIFSPIVRSGRMNTGLMLPEERELLLLLLSNKKYYAFAAAPAEEIGFFRRLVMKLRIKYAIMGATGIRRELRNSSGGNS